MGAWRWSQRRLMTDQGENPVLLGPCMVLNPSVTELHRANTDPKFTEHLDAQLSRRVFEGSKVSRIVLSYLAS